jgi:hypothetical protein
MRGLADGGKAAEGEFDASRNSFEVSTMRLPGRRPPDSRAQPKPGRAAAQAWDWAMTDEVEITVAPSAIEKAMAIFEAFKERDHAELVQARKALTDHIFGQVAAGQTDAQMLVVSGLTHLKSLERMAEVPKR